MRESLTPCFPRPILRLNLLTATLSLALMMPVAVAQTTQPGNGATADTVMAQVESQAAAEHKSILVAFGASWCGNCRLFERFLADPAIHPIMGKAFVFADLDTGERANDQRHANIPGGRARQTSLGGAQAGYPYLVMLDAKGKLLAGSMRPVEHKAAENIGYPDSPSEIEWFLEMLKRSAPALTPDDLATIHTWLSLHSSTH